MGVEDLSDENKQLPVEEHTTVQQLINIYGREAVRRGLEYIENLSEADKAYRESPEEDQLKQGVERAYDVEKSGENVEEAENKWARAMEDKGLGLDDE